MFVDPPELAPDLEWMVQSGQVSQPTLLRALVREYGGTLFSLAKFQLRDSLQAWQATRLALTNALLELHRYRPEFGIRIWLYRLTLAACKKVSGSPSMGEIPPDVVYLPDYSVFTPGKQDAAHWQAFNALESDSQLELFLHLALDLSPDDIAGITRKKAERIHSHLHAAQQAYVKPLSSPVEDPANPALLDHLTLLLRVVFSPALDEIDQNRLHEEVTAYTTHRRHRRGLSISIKEITYVIPILALVLAFFYYTNSFSPFPRPTPIILRQTVVVRVTATPAAEADLVATPTPYSRRGEFKNAFQATAPVTPGSANLDHVYLFPADLPKAVIISFSQPLSVPLPEDLKVGLNNSGPISLAWVLSHWGWSGKPERLLNTLQPNLLDENVMPYELTEYASEKTSYNTLLRFGGDTILLNRILAAGYPVIIEWALHSEETAGWIGRYDVVVGFDEVKDRYSLVSPYISDQTLQQISTGELEFGWRALNYTFLVVFPKDHEQLVKRLLAEQANVEINWKTTAQKASNEIFTSRTDLERFYAWFNRGTSLTYLDDFYGAAAAYDQAYAIYDQIPENKRPWRIIWYQTRPYWAYFYTGRFEDVVHLATATLAAIPEPLLEESYYWRALAREALGDLVGALADLQESVRLNPNFSAGLFQLSRLEEGS